VSCWRRVLDPLGTALIRPFAQDYRLRAQDATFVIATPGFGRRGARDAAMAAIPPICERMIRLH
jgi:hypothetical protein